MKMQEFIIYQTQGAMQMFYNSARSMPEDKLTWQPEETARTPLDLAQECAYFPLWMIPLLVDRKSPEYTPEDYQAMKDLRASWTTVDACEAACRENSEKYFAAIRAIPDDELDTMVDLPFAPGMKDSLAGVAMFHYWNLVYHLGQINYVQRMYGDVEMHG